MKKKLMYKMRKPISYVLAALMLLSALSVGLTVWAADVSKEQAPSLTDRVNALSTEEEKTVAEMTLAEFEKELESIKGDDSALFQFLAEQLDEEMVDYALSDIRDNKINPANLDFEYIMNTDLGTMGSTDSGGSMRYGFYLRDLPTGQIMKFAMTWWAIFDLHKTEAKDTEYNSAHWTYTSIYARLKALLPERITYSLPASEGSEPRADTWGENPEYKYAVFLRAFSGMWENWSISNSNASRRFTCTIFPAREYAYLTQYPTLDAMPDTIPTQYGMAAAHTRRGSFVSGYYYSYNLGTVQGILNTGSYWNPFHNSGISYGPDTTSKGILTNFSNVFTSHVLNMKAITDLSSGERKALLEQGQGILDSISTWSVDVSKHFFPKGEADTYEEATAFERAQTVYTTVKTLTEQARDSYLSAVNTANDTYGVKELAREDLPLFEALLNEADAAYGLLSEEQLAEQEIIDARVIHEVLRLRLAQGYEDLFKSDYDVLVERLVDLLKQDYVVNNLTANPVMDDNAEQELEAVVNVYYELLQLAISFDPDLNTADMLGGKIAGDVAAVAAADYSTYAMADKLALLACDGKGTDTPAVFTGVSTPLLHTYNSIADIPESFIYRQTTLTYQYVDGTVSKERIRLVTEEHTDTGSYEVFHNWLAVFNDNLMNGDLSAWDILELIETRANINEAFDKVSIYSAKIQAHLLAPDMAGAEARLSDLESAIADWYVRRCAELVEEYMAYADKGMNYDQCIQFFTDVNTMDACYLQIADVHANRADVLAAQQSLLDLRETFKDSFMTVYIGTVQELEQFYVDDVPVITMQNAVLVDSVLNKADKVYENLTEEQKAAQGVIDAKAVADAFRALVEEAYKTANWTPTEVNYAGMSNVTKEALEATISKLDTVIGGEFVAGLLQLPEGDTLGDLIMDAVNGMFSADLVNEIMKFLYPQVWGALRKAVDDAGSIAAIAGVNYGSIESSSGINARPSKLLSTNCIPDKYTNVKAGLGAAPDIVTGNVWDFVDWTKMDWVDNSDPNNPVPVHDYDTFLEALGSAMNGAWKLFRIMLYDENLVLSGVGSIAGNQMDGQPSYSDVLIPLYQQLGCTGYMDYNTAKSDGVWTNSKGHLKNLIDPILNRVKEIADAPVEGLLSILPQLAYIFHYNLITQGLDYVIKPLKMGSITSMLPAELDLGDLNGLLSGIDLGGIKLPLINTGELAGIAERTGDGYSPALVNTAKLEVKSDEMLVYLLRMVLDVVKDNQDMVMGLLGETPDPVVEKLLTTVLGQENDTIINALIGFLNPKSIEDINWDMTDWSWMQSQADYPADGSINNQDVAKAVQKIDLLINAVMNEFMQSDLSELVNGAVFTEENLNNLTMTIYRAIDTAGLGDILSVVGIDPSRSVVAAALQSVSPSASQAILGADSWANVDLTGCTWDLAADDLAGISTADKFAAALAKILKPFNPLLKILLVKEELTVLDGLIVPGANGYSNAVLPLLQALGCEALDADAYKTLAGENEDNILLSIVLPLFDTLEEVLENPVGTLAAKLPNFANFMANGGLTKAVHALLLPITNLTDPLLELFADENGTPDLFDFIIDLTGIELPAGLDLNDLENSIIPLANGFLQNLTIGGATLSLTLPEIKWETLAGHGTQDPASTFFAKVRDFFSTGNNPAYFEVISDVGDTAMAVLNYLTGTLQQNADAIKTLIASMLTSGETALPENVTVLINNLVDTLLGERNQPQDISAALVKVLIVENPADKDWSALDFVYKVVTTVYPSEIDADDVLKAIGNLDVVIGKLVKEFTGGSLHTLVNNQLYTTANLEAIVNALYGALAEQTQILDILGVTLPAVESLNLDGTSRASFVQGLSDALAPFAPVLRTLLVGGNLTLFNSVEIKGANGYKNAVLPILYALGCNNALSPDDYKTTAEGNDSALLSGIINPVLDLAEEIMDAPLDTLTRILPNFAYFMNNKGFTEALNGLLLPLTNIADPVLALVTDQSLLAFVLDVIEQLTGNEIGIDVTHIESAIFPLVTSLLTNIEVAGTTINIELPDIDWATLSGRGELKDRENTFVAFLSGTGNSIMNKYVEADQSAVMFALLNYLVATLQLNQNTIFDLVDTLIAQGGELDPTIEKLIAFVKEKLAQILGNNKEDISAALVRLAVLENPADNDWDAEEFFWNLADKIYPSDLEDNALRSITNIDTMIKGLVKNFTDGSSLKELVGGMLYTTENLTTLVTTIYDALAGQTDILNVLGVTLPPVESLALDGTTRAGFVSGLSKALAPFAPVLKALLTGDNLPLFNSVEIMGGNGYKTAVLPILYALGCENVMTPDEYKAAVQINDSALISGILNPILDLVERLLDAPVDTLTSILPNFAYFVSNNGFSKSLKALLRPLSNAADPVLGLIDETSFIDFVVGVVEELAGIEINIDFNDLEANILPLINSFLQNLTISGVSVSLQLPDIDWAKLAGRGELKNRENPIVALLNGQGGNIMNKYVEADQADTMFALLNYLIDTVKLNQETLFDLVDTLIAQGGELDETMTKLLDLVKRLIGQILANDTTTISETFVKLITLENPADVDWDAIEFAWDFLAQIYPDNVTSDDVAKAIDRLDVVINKAMQQFTGSSLNDFVGSKLYTTENLETVVNAIYNALAGQNDILSLLGITLGTVEDLNLDGTTREGFVKGMSDALAPFAPLLEMLLLKGDLTLMDAVTLKGANGYKNAVMPILYALGCEPMSANDYEQAVQADPSALIAGILNPILDLAEKVMASPVDTLAGILPTFAYFMNNRGFTKALNALLLPITNITDPVLALAGEESLLAFALDVVEELTGTKLDITLDHLESDVMPLINSLLANIDINGTVLSLEVPNIDWAELAGYGTKKSRTPVADIFNNGNIMNQYIEADKAAVTLAVVNYAVDTLKLNEQALLALIESLLVQEGQDASANKLLTFIKETLVTILANPTIDISAALVRLVILENPEDVDWDAYNFVWKLSQTIYPTGIDSEDAGRTIANLDILIDKAAKKFLGGSVKELADGALYTTENLEAVVNALYSALEGQEEILGILNITLPTVESLQLDGTTRAGFVTGLSKALEPFAPILKALLIGENLALYDTVEIMGANGYKNAIMPILYALGCNPVSAADYAADAAQDDSYLISNLVNPVLDLAEKFMNAPVDTLTSILPNFAYFMSNDGFTKALNAFILPLTNVADSVLGLITDESLIQYIVTVVEYFTDTTIEINFDNLESNIMPLIASLLTNIEIGGAAVTFKLPDINWSTLAGRGELMSRNSFLKDLFSSEEGSIMSKYVEADQAAVMLALLNYMVDALKMNRETLLGLIDTLIAQGGELDETTQKLVSLLKTYIDDILQKNDTPDISAAFIKVIAAENPADVDWNAYNFLWNASQVTYPDSITSGDVDQAIINIDRIVDNLVNEFAGTNLKDLVGTALYTTENLETIVKALYSMLAEQGDILNALGGIQLPEIDSLHLDGSTRVGFVKGLSDALAPFAPVLKALLIGTDLEVYELVELKGANGYKNAILPILYAFGCDNALTPDAYKAAVEENDSALIAGIINPVLDLAERLMRAPMDTLTSILPNLAYFIDNGGLSKALDGLLLPITNVADPVLSLITDDNLITFALGLVEELTGVKVEYDLENLESNIMPLVRSLLADVKVNDIPLNLQIKDIDWATLAGHGSLQNRENPIVALFNGTGSSIMNKYVEANQADTLFAVMNYVVDTVKLNENQILSLIKNLILPPTVENPDQTTLKLLELLDKYLPAILNNKTEDISAAIIQLLTLDNPEDVEWNAYDFVWKLSEALYPNGVSGERAEKAIETVDKAVRNILRDILDTSVIEMAGKALYTTENLEAVVNGLYGALAEQTQILDILGITLPAVESLKLDGRTRASFVDGLSEALAAFGPVLKMLLTGENLMVANSLEIKGANGYKNAVLPLLYALGCDNAMTATEYKAAVEADESALIRGILNPVLDLAEKVMDAPVSTLTGLLPNLAYFMSNGGVSKALNNLVLPFSNLADPILSLLNEGTLLEFAVKLAGELTDLDLGLTIDPEHIEDSIIPLVNMILKDVEIGGEKGIQLPEIDWERLAGYGELKNRSNPVMALLNGTGNSVMNKYVEANKGDTFIGILRYVIRTVHYRKNAEIIGNLVGKLENELVNEIAGNILEADADTLIKIIIDLLAPTGEKTAANWVYYAVIKENTTTYTKHLDREGYAKGLEVIDENLLGLLNQFAGIESLEPLLSDNLYTQDMVGTLAGAIFGLLNEESLGFDVISILQYVGIDLSPKGVASKLTEPRYTRAVQLLNEAEDWSQVNFGGISWGFKDGDRAAFLGTVVALLRPLENVLRYVLTGEDLVLFDSLTLTGGEGYNNAIIPLLETLQCGKVRSAEAYKERVNKNPDFLLLDIINPLFDKVEELLKKPVYTLTELLPNVALFMANDGVEQLAANLILPISDLLGTIAPIYSVNIDLSSLRNIDIIGVANKALSGLEVNGEPLGMELLGIDWKTIASRGEQTTILSQRVDGNGTRVAVPYVKADQPAVLVSVLRYLVNTIKAPSNLAVIKGLVSDLEGIGSMVGGLLDSIGEMETDDMVEMLMQLLAGAEWDEGGSGTNTPSTTTPSTTTPSTSESTTESTTQGAGSSTQPGEEEPGEEPGQEEGKKANWPLIIGCTAGGLILLGIVVFLILRNRKKKAGTGAAETQETAAQVK